MPIFTSTQVLRFCLPSLFQCKCVVFQLKEIFPYIEKHDLNIEKDLNNFIYQLFQQTIIKELYLKMMSLKPLERL